MVVTRNSLFGGKREFIGFQEKSKGLSVLPNIMKYPWWMEREAAENSTMYKQPIAYIVLLSCDRKVFVYQRSKEDADCHEKRLQGKFSLGVGGHIKPIDKDSPDGVILGSMRREVKEEIEEEIDCENARLLGFINLDHDVHAVHFGLLYVIQTNLSHLTPKDPEITTGEFRTILDLRNIIKENDVEEWSKVAFDPLCEFLQN